jgi:hypothetical protein
MNRLSVITVSLLVIAFSVFGCATTSPDSGWITLIDGGKGLENWNRIGDANWRVEDGAIVADKGKGGHLVSKNSYRNFQIRAEFWADHTTNSGIFIRCTDPPRSRHNTRGQHFDQRPTRPTAPVDREYRQVSPMPKMAAMERSARRNELIVG